MKVQIGGVGVGSGGFGVGVGTGGTIGGGITGVVVPLVTVKFSALLVPFAFITETL
jgi:hypothetical protein